jgi:ABC-type transport system involved in multi-copper enzyme maturation permease subunit
MLPTIARVAVNVFKESVRDKVLYNLVVFAVLLMAASYLIGQLTAGQDVKIIKDLGLAAIATFGLMIAIFIGIGLVWKEVERRSIYSILSKPVSRAQFVIGKYFGLVFTLAVNIGVMTVAWYAVLAYMATTVGEGTRASWAAPATDPAMLKAILLIFIELMLVTALALFFSTFSSPFLSAGLTLGFWVVGHFNADLRNFQAVVDSRAAAWLARGLYYVLPNFGSFDVKYQVVHALPVPASYLVSTALYGAVYIALLITAAVTVFSRRDFK